MKKSFLKSFTFKRIIFLLILIINFGLNAQNETLPDTIKIAVSGPITGNYAAFGEQFVNGAKQAVKDINNNGGILGKKVELLEFDDACEPKQAVNVANRSVDRDGVNAVIGHFCSSSTIPASDVYADSGVLMITPGSTNPQVTDRGLPTIFRICGRDDQQGSVAAKFILNTLKAKRVAIIHDKDTYGKGIADATKHVLNENGVKEILYEGLTRDEKDFTALVTKLKSLNPDVVYFGGLYTEAGPLVRQMREFGLKAKFISGDGIVTKDFFNTAGGAKYVTDVYMTFGKDPKSMIEGQKVIKTFKNNNIKPEGYTLYSYASMQAIADAIKNTKSIDGMKLAKYLHENSVNTIIGKKSWNNKGDLSKTDYVMYTWLPNGKYTEVINNK
tara:strand:+ start:7343 stop:8500 length:1158 start_codon:yes stop_codon:yes gene_type:complete